VRDVVDTPGITVDDDAAGHPGSASASSIRSSASTARADRATGGCGLGLSFVRLIAHHHGGKAWIAVAARRRASG
jgi:signal transduction histidine kinase